MLAIAADLSQLVTLSDLARDLGVGPSQVQKPLVSLVESGLLVPHDVPGGRYRLYVPVESPAWAWAEELKQIAVERAHVKVGRT
jgi:DNA-binding IclR family transcriptional regulator